MNSQSKYKEPCRYCEHDYFNIEKKYLIFNSIQNNGFNVHFICGISKDLLICESSIGEFSTKIKYCPICGRDLIE